MAASIAARCRKEWQPGPASSADHCVLVAIHRAVANDAFAREEQIGGGGGSGPERRCGFGSVHVRLELRSNYRRVILRTLSPRVILRSEATKDRYPFRDLTASPNGYRPVEVEPLDRESDEWPRMSTNTTASISSVQFHCIRAFSCQFALFVFKVFALSNAEQRRLESPSARARLRMTVGRRHRKPSLAREEAGH